MQEHLSERVHLLWHWADSVVFSLWKNERVLKIYDGLSIQTLWAYHRIQSDAARRVQDELWWKLSFSGRIAEKTVRNINLRILPLTQEMISPLSEELANLVKLPGYNPKVWTTTSNIPYIWGKNLSFYGREWWIVRDMINFISEELEELKIPVWWANAYNGIHPANVKVFTEGSVDSISLVITDIWASIKWTLALSK